MNKYLASAVFAAVGITATATAAQDTTTGNLNVTTSVSATCDSPNPAGNLSLPFTTEGNDWANQEYSVPVAVSVACSGGASPSEVRFGDGDNAGAADTSGRTMVTAVDGTTNACLLYELQATDDDPTVSPVWDTQLIGQTATNDGYGLNGSATFYVRGKIFRGSSDCTADTNPDTMPGGNYNDTLVMTVEFTAS